MTTRPLLGVFLGRGAKPGGVSPPPAGAAEKPNFLLIIADDLCWRDLGCTGNKDVSTPNIDALAKSGVSLRGMFTPAPTCSPTRHALYTGLYSVRSGAYPNHTMVYPGTKSVFHYLKERGYDVALYAKEHVNPKASFPYEHVAPAGGGIKNAADYIKGHASKPWMLVVASHEPHGPWNKGPKGKYDPARLTVPPYLHDNRTTREALAAYYAEITDLDGQVGAVLKALDDSKQAENTLVLFISEQGSSFPYGGKWSLYDNGIRVAAFARWPGKIKPGSSSDALMQYVDVAPTFVALAGGDPAKIDTGCKDASGNTGFDGRDFSAVLLGKADGPRDYVYAHHTTVGINGYKEPYPIRAVRDARYKLIRNLAPENTYEIGGIHKGPIVESWKQDAKNDPKLAARVEWLYRRPAEELYDLRADEYETRNLAGDPKLAEVKARLGKELDAWMKQQGDKGMETEKNALARQPRNAKKEKD